jgi:hypothetical protein
VNIGVFDNGWWKEACRRLGLGAIDLPVAAHPSGNAYAADLTARLTNGPLVTKRLTDHDVDLLVDNGATGLGFIQADGTGDELRLTHEIAGKLLCSHFIDPITTALQGLPWPVVYQCLQSQSWVKAVWDRAQVAELEYFGVPGVVHLPMAAPDRAYDTSPPDPASSKPIVSFIGGQNTAYFAANVNVPTSSQVAGTLAHAVRSDLPQTSFYEAYHDYYGLGEPILADDSADIRANKTLAYFNAKFFFHAALCLHNRDRFVIYLKQKLGDRFHLVGARWDTAYGLQTAPRIDPAEAYFQHFREAAINLNLVNGNAETGLNMRHFEVTAAGGFMLCYDQPEIEEHFEVGKECAVFRDEVDLMDKIAYYLSHPDERAEIALAGQRRTLSTHLYSHRLQSLLRQVRPEPQPVECTSNAC